MEFIIGFVLWVVLGIIAAGISNAQERADFPTIIQSIDIYWHLMIGVVGGPFALFVNFIMSGFCHHGWTLSNKSQL